MFAGVSFQCAENITEAMHRFQSRMVGDLNQMIYDRINKCLCIILYTAYC